MNILKISIIALILLRNPGCFFYASHDTYVHTDLSPREKSMMTQIRIGTEADEIEAHWTDRADSSRKSLSIVLTNIKVMKLADPTLTNMASRIVDSVIAADDYQQKYDTIKIVFKEKSGLTQNEAHFKVLMWGPEKIKFKIAKLTSPVAVISGRVLELERNKDYEGIISFADSMEDTSTAVSEICERSKALAFMELGDTSTAIQHYLAARRLQPYDGQNCLNLANVYDLKHDYKTAVVYLDTAILLFPENETPRMYCIRSRYEYNAGLKEKACDDAQKAVRAGYGPASELVKTYCK